MKKHTLSFALVLSISLPVFSQANNNNLYDVCHSDVDIIDNVVEIIQSGSSSGGFFSAGEAEQVRSILDSAEDQTDRNKLSIVLEACSDGRIFQERHRDIIDAS